MTLTEQHDKAYWDWIAAGAAHLVLKSEASAAYRARARPFPISG